jgi:hypothetical protein
MIRVACGHIVLQREVFTVQRAAIYPSENSIRVISSFSRTRSGSTKAATRGRRSPRLHSVLLSYGEASLTHVSGFVRGMDYTVASPAATQSQASVAERQSAPA